MIKICLICVGKLKEKYLKDAVSEYLTRLSRFAVIDIVEVSEEYCGDNPNSAIIEKVKEKEGERILQKIKKEACVISLDLKGTELDSVAFAKVIEQNINNGKSFFYFIIGGSFGLSEDVLNKSDFRLCLSKMTFPHQLARVIILEQLYRIMKINNGETYHK